MPTVPAAATLDQIETKLAEATRLGAADLHQTSDKLLTAKTNLEEAEADTAAAAHRATQTLRQPALDTTMAISGKKGFLSRIDRLLNGDPASDKTAAINNDIDQTLRALNPKYDRTKSAYKENCTGVVQAYELRRRGFEVQPGPLELKLRKDQGGPGGRSLDVIEKPWGGKFTVGTKADIEAAFREPGSRGIVVVAARRGAHVFNVENVDGQVRFIDAQPTPPLTDASRHFDNIEISGYLRLDTLPTPPASATRPYLEPGSNGE